MTEGEVAQLPDDLRAPFEIDEEERRRQDLDAEE